MMAVYWVEKTEIEMVEKSVESTVEVKAAQLVRTRGRLRAHC